jgi:hypothetical protein
MGRYTALLGCLLVAGTTAHAQGRWVVEPKLSLAWWQVDPHLSHLWATTCPGDTSWRPGEGRSGGWSINPNLKLPRTGYSNASDTIHVPVYPRPVGGAYPICVEAVKGELSAPDTLTWRGVRGEIVVLGDALVSGEGIRDTYMHKIMGTDQFPEIHFSLDSVTNFSRKADTLTGTAAGTFTLHGVKKSVTARVKEFPDAGGMRVMAKFSFPASMLLHDFGFSKYYMNLGVGTGIWHTLFMGVDVVMKPASTTANSRGGSN